MGHARVRSLIAVLAVAVAAVGCSSDSKGSSSSSTSSSSEGVTVPASSGPTASVTVGDTKGTDGPMTLTVTPASVSAGDVTFTVKNTGTIEHEVVVLKTDTAFDKLPIGAEEADKVSEATSQGETGDPGLQAGETRSFTISGLAAGSYVLVCNIAKHYGLGMRAAFKVT